MDPTASRAAASSAAPWRIYNIGNNTAVEVLELVALIEQALGRTATRELMPMQPGDAPETCADVEDLMRDVGFRPATPLGPASSGSSPGTATTTASDAAGPAV